MDVQEAEVTEGLWSKVMNNSKIKKVSETKTCSEGRVSVLIRPSVIRVSDLIKWIKRKTILSV